MSNFCDNPECQCFSYPDDKDQILIPDGSNGDYKSVKRTQYISHSKERGYERLYFCSVCMGVLERIKMTI